MTVAISVSLGCVHAAQSHIDNSQINECAEHTVELTVTSARVAEEPINAIALLVQFAVTIPRFFCGCASAARREQSRVPLRILA
ncbi:hypothetical protein, partial [Treponema endosymbiont of Eucomonympha sp.]|uniref:hypothetical protein n=1 Tax=Treponema endosymbiont of Eucomonympha sp. TaxID=1580831 RepID=UPI001E536852